MQRSEAVDGSFLQRVREHELQQLRPYFQPGLRVLDFGSGAGFHAAMLREWGCRVTAVDVAPALAQTGRVFEPVIYDGRRLPFRDHAFDIVYSSNVLEHIPDVSAFLPELSRVCRPGGLCIHVMPSAAWRFWTSAAFYPHAARRVLTRAAVRPLAPDRDAANGSEPARYRRGARLAAAPHGEYPSALSELYFFSARRWRTVFQDSGLVIEKVVPSGCHYSGYTRAARLAGWRTRLAPLFGSACNVFVVRPQS